MDSEIASFYPPEYNCARERDERGAYRRWLTWLEYRLFFRPLYEAQIRLALSGIGWGGQPGMRLLDIGCGRGVRLLGFQERGFEVHGVDFNAEEVEYLRGQLAIPATCGDVSDLTRFFPAGSFDVVTAFHLLEHVPSVARVLNGCYQVLRPGGWFVGAVPLVDSIQARLLRSHWAGVTEAPRHLSLPSRQGLRTACAQAGFVDIRLRPEVVLNAAGIFVLSVMPSLATATVYGSGGRRTGWARLLGAPLTLLALPFCVLESYVFRQPGVGIVFARRPL